jgi:hypothetical protein
MFVCTPGTTLHAAERRLLCDWERQARRHGLRSHQIVTWVRRKCGPDLVVWRTLQDGSYGCATPCVLCQREVLRYDFRVHCPLSSQQWYVGRLDDAGAPVSKLTTSQRRTMLSSNSDNNNNPSGNVHNAATDAAAVTHTSKGGRHGRAALHAARS